MGVPSLTATALRHDDMTPDVVGSDRHPVARADAYGVRRPRAATRALTAARHPGTQRFHAFALDLPPPTVLSKHPASDRGAGWFNTTTAQRLPRAAVSP